MQDRGRLGHSITASTVWQILQDAWMDPAPSRSGPTWKQFLTSGSISRFSIAPGGALTLLGSTPVRATSGVGAVDARLSPDGRYLFVDESKIGAVGAFAVNGGNLTELAGSPTSLPSGATPAGIVVTG